MNSDLYLFNAINQFGEQWLFLDYSAVFFAKYFEYFLLSILFSFLIINFKKYWRMVVEAFFAALFVRFVLAEIIGIIWFRPRPFVNNSVHLLFPYFNPTAPSFPSGHASFYFALSTIIYAYNKKAGILFYIASFLIVAARIFAGLHWPSDVLAGMILGIGAGLLLNRIFLKMR